MTVFTVSPADDFIADGFNLYAADGDIIELEDGNHDIASQQTNRNHALQGSGGTLTIRSQSGNPAACRLRSTSATDMLLRFNETTDVHNYVFEDLTITKSVPHTGTASTNVLMSFERVCGDIVFRRVNFADITVDVGASTFPELFRTVNTARTITFDHCTWNGLQLCAQDGSAMLEIAGGQTAVFIENTVRDSSFTWSGNGSGCITAATDARVFCRGTFQMKNLTYTQNSADQSMTGMFDMDNSAGVFVADRLSVVNCNAAGGYCRSVTGRMRTCYTINSIYMSDCIHLPTASTVGLGGGLLVHKGGYGTVGFMWVRKSRQHFGVVIYSGGGGSGAVGTVVSEDNLGHQGGVYSGGDGDFTVNAYLCSGMKNINAQHAQGGLCYFAHVNASTSARHKTVVLNHFTFANNAAEANGLPYARIKNDDPVYTLTGSLNNGIFENSGGAGEELNVAGSNTGAVVTANSCYFKSGADTSATQSQLGSLTVNAEIIAADPGFIDFAGGNYRLHPQASPCYLAGRNIGSGVRDVEGYDFIEASPSVGAYEAARPCGVNVTRRFHC